MKLQNIFYSGSFSTADRIVGLYVILWNLAGSSHGTDIKIGLKEVCATEKFEAKCPDGEVIVMDTALLGRMRIGRCVREDYGRLGCSVDVLGYMDTMCSGRSSCSVKVSDDYLLAKKPCSELLSYLEASYSCVKVLSGAAYQTSCRDEGNVQVTEEHGVIASEVVAQTLSATGTHVCPWLIVVQPGQRVNITLMDYGPKEDTRHTATCHRYGLIRDREVNTPTTVCSGLHRERNIYTSLSNRVELEFVFDSTRKPKAHFLLKYTAVGCSNPPLRGHVLERRTVTSAVLYCPHSGHRWTLDCTGSNWVGYVDDCIAPEASWSMWRVLSEEWSTPQGIAITVGLGVALGTIIGVSLLVCVLIFLKRHRRQRLAKAAKMAEYEEGEFTGNDDISRKWSNNDTLKTIGYTRSDGSASIYKDSQYSQVWNDSGFTEGGNLPPRPLVSMMKPSTATPPGFLDIYERSDHVYERPK